LVGCGRNELTMPCVFDSTLINQVDELAHGMPFLVLIDPDGIVRGSTWTLDEINLGDLTKDNRPKLPDYYREHYKKYQYDPARPFLVDKNGGNDSSFLFRSVLTQWKAYEPIYNFPDSIDQRPVNFTVLGARITDLYMYAYLGKFWFDRKSPLYGELWPRLVIEVKDSANLAKLTDNTKNRFSYGLTLPVENATKAYMYKDYSKIWVAILALP